MPRIKPLSLYLEIDDALRENIMTHLYRNKMTRSELAAVLNISRSTLYKKIKSPSKFTVGELRVLFSRLRFEQEEKNMF